MSELAEYFSTLLDACNPDDSTKQALLLDFHCAETTQRRVAMINKLESMTEALNFDDDSQPKRSQRKPYKEDDNSETPSGDYLESNAHSHSDVEDMLQNNAKSAQEESQTGLRHRNKSQACDRRTDLNSRLQFPYPFHYNIPSQSSKCEENGGRSECDNVDVEAVDSAWHALLRDSESLTDKSRKVLQQMYANEENPVNRLHMLIEFTGYLRPPVLTGLQQNQADTWSIRANADSTIESIRSIKMSHSTWVHLVPILVLLLVVAMLHWTVRYLQYFDTKKI